MKLKDIAIAHVHQKMKEATEQLDYLFQRRKHVLESLRHALHNLDPKLSKAETQAAIRSTGKSWYLGRSYTPTPAEVTVGGRKWNVWRLSIPVEGRGAGDFAIPIKDSQFVQGFKLFPAIPVDHPQYEEIKELADDDAKAYLQYQKTVDKLEELESKLEHLDVLDDHDEEYEAKK